MSLFDDKPSLSNLFSHSDEDEELNLFPKPFEEDTENFKYFPELKENLIERQNPIFNNNENFINYFMKIDYNTPLNISSSKSESDTPKKETDDSRKAQIQKDIDYTIFVNEETSCHALVTIKGCGNFTGEIKYEIKIDDHETELIEREGIESTCTTKGFYYKVKRCKKCYKEFEVEKVELPLRSHVEGNWEILVPATATTSGKRVKRCTECNLILESEEIPATGVPSGTVTPINNTPAGNGTSSGNNTPVENETPVNTGTPTGTDTPVSTGTPVGTENPAGTETPANTGSDTPADTDTKTPAKTYDNPVIKTEEPVNKGSVVSDESANADYEITSTGSKKNTAQYDNFDGKATTVEIPETVKVNDKVYSVTTLDPKAFAGNTVVKKVVRTDKITKISKNSFNGCTGLKKLVFGSNTKVIGANALKGCSSLTSLNITENVENIRKNAFAGCDNLKKLVIRSNKFTNESEIKNVLKNLSEGCAVYVTKVYLKILLEKKINVDIIMCGLLFGGNIYENLSFKCR